MTDKVKAALWKIAKVPTAESADRAEAAKTSNTSSNASGSNSSKDSNLPKAPTGEGADRKQDSDAAAFNAKYDKGADIAEWLLMRARGVSPFAHRLFMRTNVDPITGVARRPGGKWPVAKYLLFGAPRLNYADIYRSGFGMNPGAPRWNAYQAFRGGPTYKERPSEKPGSSDAGGKKGKVKLPLIDRLIQASNQHRPLRPSQKDLDIFRAMGIDLNDADNFVYNRNVNRLGDWEIDRATRSARYRPGFWKGLWGGTKVAGTVAKDTLTTGVAMAGIHGARLLADSMFREKLAGEQRSLIDQVDAARKRAEHALTFDEDAARQHADDEVRRAFGK